MDTIEEILKDMVRFGRPRLHCFDDMTWLCGLNVLVIGDGVSFEIKSDSTNATPLAAAQQCHERMRKALRDVGEQTKRLPV